MPEAPRPLIDGPSAWYGPDLEKSAVWRHDLSAVALDEIDAALAHVESGGKPLIDVGRDDFPLPTLGPQLLALRDDLLDGRGFTVLRGLPVDRYDRRQATTIFWGVGAWIGRPRSQNANGHLMGHVCDLGYDLNDPAVRIYQTSERQTFHTDSCDVVALMCLKTAKSGGLSALVSSMTLYNEMARRQPELAAVLFRPFATDRRGEVPAGQKPYFEIPVFNDCEGRLSAIYQRRYIDSARRFDDVPPLSKQEAQALDLFDELTNDPALNLKIAFEPGDMQFVCNHVILHDRTAFEDWPNPADRRHLLRLWLCPEIGRPLPPAYAARYGSTTIGDRGGIHVPGTQLTVPLEPV